MVIKLKGTERSKKDQIIAEKNREGYTCINITESYDSMISGPGGNQNIPSLVLEFKKI